MGDEAKCVLRMNGKKFEGKALLETGELIFRGAETRLKIAFAEMHSVTAEDGELRIKAKDHSSVFEVGPVAEKWREKILHPKTRVEKLGVKAGMRVCLLGDAEAVFVDELRQSKAEIVSGSPDGGAELIFLFVDQHHGLSQVLRLAKKMKGAAGLWIAYPKGKKEIAEVDVIGAGRKAGLKDVKVVGFSETHTALKFVIPLEKR